MSIGHRCGYVGVPIGHSLFGLQYMDIDNDINVHGGITYSDKNGNYPIKNNELWWFGFDCAHYGDAQDYEQAFNYGLISKESYERYQELEDKWPTKGTKRGCGYVENECKSLARQLMKITEVQP
jgi:hypothetical protein